MDKFLKVEIFKDYYIPRKHFTLRVVIFSLLSLS